MRITFSAIILTLLLGASISLFSFIAYRNSTIERHASEAAHIATSIAATIDASLFYASIQNDEPDEFWHITRQQVNSAFTRITDLTFLYIMWPYQNTWRYYVSGIRPGDPDYVYFGLLEDPDIYGIEALTALRYGVATTTGIFDAGEWGMLISGYAPIMDEHGRVFGLVGADFGVSHVATSINRFGLTLAAFALVGSIAFGLLLRFTLKRSLSISLRRIVTADHTFSDANSSFAARIEDNDSSDEISALYRQFDDMFNGFKRLLTDIQAVVDAHIAGYHKVKLDESKYSGGHLRLVQQVNAVLSIYSQDLSEVINVMKHYGEGDFTATVRTYEGDWDWANKVMADLRENLVHVTKEIDKLAKNAMDGEFDLRADIDKQQGEWARIIQNLNALMQAVANPMSEIENNMLRMSKGDFVPMQGQYKGQFDMVKQAYNRTNEATIAIINEISQILAAIAEGDLTVRLQNSYVGSYAPIETALKTILEKLNKSMNEINSASSQVLESAGLLTQSSMMLADGSARQSASIEELTASIDSISQKANDSATNATEANERVANSVAFAKNAEKVLSDMLVSMDKLSDSSEDISKIIKTISDIAYQTNLLALNASVEAARAGEHGKGFAVVADEVRILASRSQASVNDTTSIIDKEKQYMESGRATADNVATSFTTIMDDINEMSSIVEQIALMSNEQVESINIVNNSVTEISKVVTDNSATAQESAAASQELVSQAEALKRLVSFFRIR